MVLLRLGRIGFAIPCCYIAFRETIRFEVTRKRMRRRDTNDSYRWGRESQQPWFGASSVLYGSQSGLAATRVVYL